MMQAKYFAFALAAVLVIAPLAAAEDYNEDTRAVEHASYEFYASLNKLFEGDVAPMINIWSHADDVSYMGPAGGFQVGWERVRAQWEEQAALKLGGKIEPDNTRITVGDDIAFVQAYEQGDNVDPQGKLVQVSIRATTIFRKEAGQWRVIAHQTDLIPQLEQEVRTRAIESAR